MASRLNIYNNKARRIVQENYQIKEARRCFEREMEQHLIALLRSKPVGTTITYSNSKKANANLLSILREIERFDELRYFEEYIFPNNTFITFKICREDVEMVECCEWIEEELEQYEKEDDDELSPAAKYIYMKKYIL